MAEATLDTQELKSKQETGAVPCALLYLDFTHQQSATAQIKFQGDIMSLCQQASCFSVKLDQTAFDLSGLR